MPRRLRVSAGGYAYHVLNRGVGKMRLFAKERDFEAFEEVMAQAKEWLPMRVLRGALCRRIGISCFGRVRMATCRSSCVGLTVTHTQRWHAAHRTAGTGPLYQGRFKSFPIQEDDHLLTVLRYVERNPLRANMVEKADEWRWSSLWHRAHRNRAGLVDAGPVVLPRRWRQHVQAAQTEAELAALRHSVVRGSPFGDAQWQQRTAKQLGLESTLRPRGRPWPSPSEPE